jgi:hypothetical protein
VRQVGEAVGWGVQNKDPNPSLPGFLLIGHRSKPADSAAVSKNAVPQPSLLRVSRSLAIVTDEQEAQLLVDALIKQDPNQERLGSDSGQAQCLALL